MRTNSRYTRTRDMLQHESVPRLATGGIALCHGCQRWVYFKNGFLNFLIDQLERTARANGYGAALYQASEKRKAAGLSAGGRRATNDGGTAAVLRAIANIQFGR